MLRRLFALVVLLGIVAAGLYLWRLHAAGSPLLNASARDFGADARDLGAQARDKLGTVGQKIEDAKVTASVKTALSLNRNLHPYAIEVSSESGVVTLRGRVDGGTLHDKAGAVAAGVPDVVRVVNQIETTPGPVPVRAEAHTLGESLDEHTLQMQVRLALSLDRDLKGSDIKVDVTRREVTLSGKVATRAQADRALEIARDTGSVTSVVDRLHLQGMTDARGSGGATPVAVSAEGAAAAQQALRSNSSLAGFDLQVREEDGRLVLRGQLGTHAEKDLAGLLAREGAGAPVENLTEVRSGTQ